MRKYTAEKRTETVHRLTEIRCNKCGDAIPLYDEVYAVEHRGGYASKIGDMVLVSFDLCEPCVMQLMGTFVIQASIADEDPPVLVQDDREPSSSPIA